MSTLYESERLLAEYLLFHYGAHDEVLAPGTAWPVGMQDALDFAVRTARWFTLRDAERGLDVGCAVGRSSFEMAHLCRKVIGIDFSLSFIQAAKQLLDHGQLAYERCEEAALTTKLVAKRPKLPASAQLSFLVGDAMALPPELGSFDCVHAANLICRLPEPLRFLERLPTLVRPRGELVLATPCTWLKEFTCPAYWPQGPTLDWLKAHLDEHFELVRCGDEPFLIRETARKFQWTRSQVSLWQRRP